MLRREASTYAHKLVAELPVSVTGARSGELLVGCARNTMGVQLNVVEGIVRPHKTQLDAIRQHATLWQAFLARLAHLPFFMGLGGDRERSDWLFAHQINDATDLTEQASVRFQLVAYSSAHERHFSSPGSTGERLFTTGVSARTLSAHFTPDSRPSDRRAFRSLCSWKIERTHTMQLSFSRPVLDTTTTRDALVCDSCTTEGLPLYILNTGDAKGLEIGIKVAQEEDHTDVLGPDTNAVLLHRLLHHRPDAMETLRVLETLTARHWTPAAWHSLVQKIVRCRPAAVRFPGYLNHPPTTDDFELDAETVLAGSIGCLMAHPGCFVSQSRRGHEAAFFHTALLTIEESYVTDAAGIARLIVWAFLAHRVPSWRPGWTQMLACVQALVHAWREPRCFSRAPVNYKRTHNNLPVFGLREAIQSRNTWAILSAVAEYRNGDNTNHILRELANHPETRKAASLKEDSASHRRVLPLAHCTDWAPDVVYYVQPSFFLRHASKKDKTALLAAVHQTDANPRRSAASQSCPEAIQAKEAWLRQRLAPPSPPVTGCIRGTLCVQYTLDKGWIAALLGALSLAGKQDVLVTLRVSDPSQLVALRKPSRDMQTQPLTVKEQEWTRVAEGLKNGVRWVCPPFEEWKDALVRRVTAEEVKYTVQLVGETKVRDWDDLRTIKMEFPIYESQTPPSTGISSDAQLQIKRLVDALLPLEQQTLHSLLAGYQHTSLQMQQVLDDCRTQEAVVAATSVFHFLRSLSRLVPAALSLDNTSTFRIVSRPLFWYIRDTWVLPHLTRTVPLLHHPLGSAEWPVLAFPQTRVRWTHQVERVAEMLARSGQGQFVWLPTGMGKTTIVLDYAAQLYKQHRLPRHIVYLCGGKAALTTVVREAEVFGFKGCIRVYVPLRHKRKADQECSKYIRYSSSAALAPYCLTLLEHDHVRLCADTALYDILKDSLLVVDDVHKAMYDTQRSAHLLHVSRLARECIAMTCVVDASMHRLSWWLGRVMPFPVTRDNFWVAVGELIAKSQVQVPTIPRNLGGESKRASEQAEEPEDDTHPVQLPQGSAATPLHSGVPSTQTHGKRKTPVEAAAEAAADVRRWTQDSSWQGLRKKRRFL